MADQAADAPLRPPSDAASATPDAAPEIDALVAAGDYVAAARRADAAGQTERAIALLERVWRFAEALPLAERLDRPALAVRLALDARLDDRARAIAAAIPDDHGAVLAAASAEFAARGRWMDAAGLALRAQDPARAAPWFLRAGAVLESAQALARAGDFAGAGRRLVELALAATADGDQRLAGQAQLEYGILCGRLGRHRDAARALQAAAQVPTLSRAARVQLSVQLRALSLPHAAAIIDGRLRADSHTAGDTTDAAATATNATTAMTRGPAEHAPPDARAGSPEIQGALARFSDLVLIGAGSLGRVFRARDGLLGTTVVLKILAVGGNRAGAERQAFRQFVREAEASSRLQHPNIVRVYDVDEASGLLVREHLDGGTLADLIRKEGPLPVARVRRVALDVLSALAAAHRAGIVHRDVKPANVFLDAAGTAKLADFGAAHLADFGGTQTAGFIGTLGYLSPEQISGGTIGPTADLYALGATLFEALTGRLPFTGPDVVGQHLGAPPPAARDVVPGLPRACDEVIAHALAKHPADRPPSANAMAEAVRAWPQQAADPAPPLAAGATPGGARDDARDPIAGAPASSAAAPVPTPDVPIGRTAAGPLLLRLDARLGVPVVVERHARPIDSSLRATLAARAALGGPAVQRLLRIDDDQEVVYESVAARPSFPPWDTRALDALGDADRSSLAAAAAAVASLLDLPIGQIPVTCTDNGPVILLVVALSPAA